VSWQCLHDTCSSLQTCGSRLQVAAAAAVVGSIIVVIIITTIRVVVIVMYDLTGKAHWELLLRARAVETQCYVIAAAQAGRHNEKRESYGHSIIIDPWGEVVGKLDDPLATGIATAEIDLEHLKTIRTRMPIINHRQLGRDCMGLPPAVLA